MRFEALQRFYYNGRHYQAGEQFDTAQDSDADALRLLWKEVKEISAAPRARHYRTRDMRAGK